MITLNFIVWIVLLLLVLAATATLSVIAFVRPQHRLMAWLAAAGLAAAVALAALAGDELPPAIAGMITALALVAAVFGGGPAASTALDLAMGRSAVPGLHGGILVTDSKADTPPGALPARREVLRGGTTIGVLERLAAAGTIVAGFPEGLAIVVAVKGVGRFTELEAPEARERFIIGTLASLIWACAAGLVVHLALR
ncbi:hypothetical protein [Agromyces aerolatus]|uniref:hypothetical protein n=1 Tax=Agromyces sp. LY-1074 TaxID=3074080 RepID=UPI00285663A1|nr:MULTISPECIES: hypothetical protein [unclassified Agromyces]MDR5700980.1 hypothetical protein [Agromyces sp. LY-1074]MDR5707620.1 hypothetical protein [Agromyces sp. LY-1358]